MLKKSLAFLVVWAGVCYAVALTGWAFGYILAVAVLFYGVILLAVANGYWAALPGKVRGSYAQGQWRFLGKVAACLALLFVGMQAINYGYMPRTEVGVRMAAKGGLAILVGWLAWNFVRRVRIKFSWVVVVLLLLLAAAGWLWAGGDSGEKSGSVREAVDRLIGMPYIGTMPMGENSDKMGVIKHDPNLAGEGINICTSRNSGRAMLVDMAGKVLHEWVLSTKIEGEVWHFAELTAAGNLLALELDGELVKVDWEGTVIWRVEIGAHHDFFQADDGDIYLLGREDRVKFFGWAPAPVVNDYVAVVGDDGVVKRRISMLDAGRDLISRASLLKIYLNMVKPEVLAGIVKCQVTLGQIGTDNSIFDVVHTNSLELVDRRIEGVCEVGDALISSRTLDMIGMVDLATGRLRWSWGPGELSKQHHPSLLADGRILMFDNGVRRGYSRVIELEARTGKIVWEYVGDPKESFYSAARGACQRLGNGNTLITESDKGHVFEVTRAGEIVWDFYWPYVVVETQEREIVYRMMRLESAKKGMDDARILEVLGKE